METTQKSCAACSMLKMGAKFRTTPPHTCQLKPVSDNHQWIKDDSYKDSTFKIRHVCKVCGCEKLTDACGIQIFSRGCIYAMLKRPDCVDWNDRDTLNRID